MSFNSTYFVDCNSLQLLPVAKNSYAYSAVGGIVSRLVVDGIPPEDFYLLMPNFKRLTSLELSNMSGLRENYMQELFQRLNPTLTELHLIGNRSFPPVLTELHYIRTFRTKCGKIKDHKSFLWQNRTTLEELDFDCPLIEPIYRERLRDQAYYYENVDEGHYQLDLEDAFYIQLGLLDKLKKLRIPMSQSIANLILPNCFPLLDKVSLYNAQSGVNTFLNRIDGGNLTTLEGFEGNETISLDRNRFPVLNRRFHGLFQEDEQQYYY